ncbi:very short patch repair endonuclease [Pandoraea aquatica]|uniref:very short patch repair endonuclease n=1 Tax=Pandoraea aquatica TaxID=2508290 RepID=UPI0024836018|nr:DNA mismatch endonuclease Vsr [Pandoraea aquatica]
MQSAHLALVSETKSSRELHRLTDVHSSAVRSRNMSAIRAKDTRPEMLIRQGLHKRGLRFRLHVGRLPGSPDLVLPKYRTVIFVHGCFWHGHGCHLFKLPKTRTEFWSTKIDANVRRDIIAQEELSALGWRIGIVWECALKGKCKIPLDALLDQLVGWLDTPGASTLELTGGSVERVSVT